MQVVEASAVVPLGLEDSWDLFLGDQLQHLVEAVDNVIAVENYQMRPDGTPRYQMVRKVGPITMRATSDYSVFERPYRTVSRALDAPFGGTFYSYHEPVAGGTRLSLRWEVEPQNALARVMLPVVLPLLRRQLQQDAEDLAKAAGTPQRGQPQEEDQQGRAAASADGLARALGWVSIGVGLAAIAVPGPLTKAIGLGDRPNLGRLLGARDLVLGAGLLLGGQNTAAWCRARGLADALDVALIVVGAATGAFRRERAPIGVATGAGFSALSFWIARRLEQR